MSAVFSEDRVYRYTLTRDLPFTLDGEDTEILFVMLNPSTADEHVDDPTVRRCIRFAQLWGYNTVTVCNLFALRSTDPKLLYDHPDPVGRDNDAWIIERAIQADTIVAAWGTHGRLLDRGRDVAWILAAFGDVQCLGKTTEGFPKHPLYLERITRPVAM